MAERLCRWHQPDIGCTACLFGHGTFSLHNGANCAKGKASQDARTGTLTQEK
ncbi:MAG: hypothetical protein Q4D41_12320 [Prevotellaceae bacterium]|nr:hypothetical protein [Prevotellaceae bacterium]